MRPALRRAPGAPPRGCPRPPRPQVRAPVVGARARRRGHASRPLCLHRRHPLPRRGPCHGLLSPGRPLEAVRGLPTSAGCPPVRRGHVPAHRRGTPSPLRPRAPGERLPRGGVGPRCAPLCGACGVDSRGVPGARHRRPGRALLRGGERPMPGVLCGRGLMALPGPRLRGRPAPGVPGRSLPGHSDRVEVRRLHRHAVRRGRLPHRDPRRGRRLAPSIHLGGVGIGRLRRARPPPCARRARGR